MIKDMLLEIKWAYQRVRYGYDDRIKWSFDEYFLSLVKPIKEFCQDMIKNKDSQSEERIKVFSETLILIEKLEATEYFMEKSFYVNSKKLWKYVAKNMFYYWN